MKMSKKLLSLLLCAIMVLGSVAVGGGGFTEVLDAFSVKVSAYNTGNDYPYKNYCAGCHNDDLSIYNFFYRQCTDFVAWCLNSRNGVAFNNTYKQPTSGAWDQTHWSNSKNWVAAAQRAGITVNQTPAVGAVACWTSGDYGHVAWVKQVNSNGTVNIDEYNWNVSSGYGERNNITAPYYIHIAHTHSYDSSASIINAPTSSSTGTRRCYCSCGAYTDQTIPALKYTTSFDNGTICRLVSRIDGRVLATNPDSNFDAFATTNNNDYSDQEWVLLKNSDGTYTIQNKYNSSRALDISGASMVNGGNVQTYEKNGSDAQKFYIVPANGYYKLVAKNSYMCVDAGKENHSVHQWEELSNSSSAINNQLWEIKCSTFTVSYNANGGSGAPGSQTKTNGVALTLSSTKPTRSVTITLNPQSGTVSPTSKTVSYTFKNWNTKSDGSGTAYSSGATYSANAAATLYAQWTNPAAYTLPTPTRTGYNFKGWNTKSDGTGTTYAAGASYNATSNVTLYAIWNLNTYSVVYNANGGTGAPSSQTKTYGTNLTLSSTKPTRSVTITLNPQSGTVSPTSKTVSYTFENWNTNADGSGTAYSSGATYSANAAATLYAQWTNPAAYELPTPTSTRNVTITLDPQSDNVSPTSETVSYTFKNWNTKADGSGTAYSAGAAYSATANATLYAQWANFAAYTLPTPARTGYDFKGWNTKSDGTGTTYAARASYEATSNVTLYAIWSIKTYSLTYNANGGTGAPANQTKTYGNDMILSSVVPHRTGYSFSGWLFQGIRTSHREIYQPGDIYTIEASGTFYAQWYPKYYRVSFDVNGGSSLKTDYKTIHYGEKYGELPIPVRKGYEFIGWFTAVNGGGQVYEYTTLTEASNHTLYAMWKLNNYSIKFISDGNIVYSEKYDVEAGLASVPDVPKIPGKLNGRWEDFDITKGGDLEIHAIYDFPETTMKVQKTAFVGDSFRLLCSKNYNAEDRVWTSDDENIATVDSHGNVTILGEGVCYINVVNYGKDELGNPISSEAKTKVVAIEKKSNEKYTGIADSNNDIKAEIEGRLMAFIKDLLESIKMAFRYLAPYIRTK